MNREKKLKNESVDPGFAVYFSSPLQIGDQALTRTGTPNDLSFFHAILTAIDNNYTNESSEIKHKLAKKLKKRLFAELPVLDRFKECLEKIYTPGFFSNKEKKEQERYKILLEVFPISNFYTCLSESPTSVTPGGSLSLRDIARICLRKIKDVFTEKKLDKKRTEFCVSKMSELVQDAVRTCGKRCEELESIPEKIGRNIQIFDIHTRLPVVFGERTNLPKTIILVRIDKDKYETIGVISSGMQIRKEFTSTDEFCEKINCFLYDKDDLILKYPTLAKYGTKKTKKSSRRKHRKSSSSTKSDSSSERKSEPEDSQDSSSEDKSRSDSEEDKSEEDESSSEEDGSPDPSHVKAPGGDRNSHKLCLPTGPKVDKAHKHKKSPSGREKDRSSRK